MADILTVAQRSERMSRIRSRGNAGTELELARVLRGHGIKGWRRHVMVRGMARDNEAPLKVRPDFVFRTARLAVFVDGCFWHACPLHGSRPGGNAAFWRRKLRGNMERDRRVNAALKRAGWKVLRIWEHELARKNASRLARRLRRAIPVHESYP